MAYEVSRRCQQGSTALCRQSATVSCFEQHSWWQTHIEESKSQCSTLKTKAMSLEWKQLLISNRVTVHHTIVITSLQYNCKTCTVLVATLNIWINSSCDLCDPGGKILQDHSHHSEVFECSQVFMSKAKHTDRRWHSYYCSSEQGVSLE